MRTIAREAKALQIDEYRLRSAREEDVSEVVADSFQLLDPADGEVKAVYLTGDTWNDDESARLDSLCECLEDIRYDVGFRTGGLVTTSKIFGTLPRRTLRKDFCSSALLATENPSAHERLLMAGQLVGDRYRRFAPHLYTQHRMMTQQKVRAEYHLEDEVFTSGIINKNNPLKYHFDAGNYRDVWSGMLAFRQQTERGFLALPAYDIAVAIGHKSLFLFDGQKILHGVTPITLLTPDARRYSIVYYSMRGLWNCMPIDEEVRRVRRKRVEREERRASMPVLPGQQHTGHR